MCIDNTKKPQHQLSESEMENRIEHHDRPAVEYCGVVRYEEMLQRQRQLFQSMVEAKKRGESVDELILVVQHPTVLTMGRRADEGNLLANPEMLRGMGVDCVQIERGGDVTCHEPGQIVVYPLIDLEKHRLGVKQYVSTLEEAVIRTLADYGITAGRVEGATGVWIEIGTPRERKICAIGVKISRYVSMHGLAFNICNDLSGFRLINPCGFTDRGVTTLHRELEAMRSGEKPTAEEAAQKLVGQLQNLLR